MDETTGLARFIPDAPNFGADICLILN